MDALTQGLPPVAANKPSPGRASPANAPPQLAPRPPSPSSSTAATLATSPRSTADSRPSSSSSSSSGSPAPVSNKDNTIEDEDDVALNVAPPTAPIADEERARIRQAVKSLGPNRFMREYAFVKKVSLCKLLLVFRDQFTDKDWSSIEQHIMPNRQIPELYACLTIAVQRYYSKRTRLAHVSTLDDVLHLLRTRSRILLVTGAGISVSCGIPDFRSPNGIYARLTDYELTDPTDMFDLEYFKHKPETFYSFAKEIYPSNFEPSPSHMFVALLEKQGKLLRNYTQNIDNIEELAGIERVVQCHGSFRTAKCVTCGYAVPGSAIEKEVFAMQVPQCPQCPESSELPIMKPDIVFFGEQLPAHFFSTIEGDMAATDLVVVIGSSLKVAPVSEILRAVPDHVPQIIINRELLPHLKHHFDVHLLGNADTVVADLCRRLAWPLDHPRFDEEASKSLQAVEGQEPRPHRVADNVYVYEGAVLDAKWDSESESSDDSDEDEGDQGGSGARTREQTTQRLFDDDDEDEDDDDDHLQVTPRPVSSAPLARAAVAQDARSGSEDSEEDDGGISDDELAGLHADLQHAPVRVHSDGDESDPSSASASDDDDAISAEELAGLHADLLDDDALVASSLKRYRDDTLDGPSSTGGRRVSKRSRQG